jgi:hypothetical protein
MKHYTQQRLEYWLEVCHRLNKEIEEKMELRALALKRAQEWYKQRSKIKEEI